MVGDDKSLELLKTRKLRVWRAVASVRVQTWSPVCKPWHAIARCTVSTWDTEVTVVYP